MAEQKKIVMPSASFVVARSNPGNIIGCENALPWKLKTDLQRFRNLTSGHAVIMGRKTLESIGRPLPNRKNIVVSRSQPVATAGVDWVKSVEDAVFLADYYSICRNKDDFFVIGGDQIYRSFLDKNLYNRIYLTEVFSNDIKGDAYFHYEFDGRIWKTEEEIDFRKSDIDQYPFRFTTYAKKSKYVRYRPYADFLTEITSSSSWLIRQEERVRADAILDKWQQQHPVPGNLLDGQAPMQFKLAV
jgi:dihydrofolate reductase